MEIWSAYILQFSPFYWFFNCFVCHIAWLFDFLIANSIFFCWKKLLVSLISGQTDIRKRWASRTQNNSPPPNLQLLDFTTLRLWCRFVTHKKDWWIKFYLLRFLPLKINIMFKIIFSQKNIFLIYNDNIKQNHLSVKKLHLNRKSSSQFAKTLFGILE